MAFKSKAKVTFSRGPGSGKAIRINGYFALLVALGELNMDVKDFAKTIVAEHIIYAASYRKINTEIWGLIFCLLETQYPEV